MTERQTVEATPSSALAICSCGWRDINASKSSAWASAYAHAQRAHQGDNTRHAEEMVRRYG